MMVQSKKSLVDVRYKADTQGVKKLDFIYKERERSVLDNTEKYFRENTTKSTLLPDIKTFSRRRHSEVPSSVVDSFRTEANLV